MKAIITKIQPAKKSKHGGMYNRVFFKSFEDNKHYRLDIYENHPLSRRFYPYLKEQAIFDNLLIYKANIINGTSSFRYLGINTVTKTNMQPELFK